MISIICAIAQNGAIGYDNHLLYRLSADLKRFKALTSGHTVVMGRRTFESLPKGALPNRRNIVLSRTATAWSNTEVFPSLDEALAACAPNEEVFIIGGAAVYEAALERADRLCLTLIEATPDKADTFFPDYDKAAWRETQREHYAADEKNEADFTFVDYIRK